MKTFHHGLRAVHGPKSTGTTPVRAADQTTLLADKADILTRWAEHFNKLLNRESSISDAAIAALPQLKENDILADLPSRDENITALQQTTPRRAPGSDCIQADI